MGMFDSMIDNEGNEWQTKAFGRLLDRYQIGDFVSGLEPDEYQIKVLGDKGSGYAYSYATIQSGFLDAVDVPRDPRLPLLDYQGGWLSTGEGA